jgi:hypothetical protein
MPVTTGPSLPPSIALTSRSYGSFADHEPGLWRAVITQALMDAATSSAKPEARRFRTDAISWLLSYSDDFESVCDNANLCPDYVRSRAITALERNCQWRLPAGQGWRARARQQAESSITQLALID